MEPVRRQNGVGREATQRHGRHAAVQRDAQPAHPHAEGGGHRRRRLRRRVQLRRVPPHHPAPPAPARPAALPARRHPVEAAPSDVDGELRRRPRLPPAPGAGPEPRRTPRTRPGHRRDRQHAPGPRPPAVGVPFRRGDGRRPLRADRQGAPHAGRRCRFGQSAGPADGPDRLGTDERDDYTTCEPPSKSELLRAAGRDHVQNIAALPGLVRDAVRGFARVRRRSKERSDDPDMAKMFKLPPTFLNHVVSPVRTFATASLSLAEVKETAKQLGVTFNDIVLAMAAGGLRELLLRYDGRADRPIIASVPVATDKSTGPDHRQRDQADWPSRCLCTSTTRWSGSG